MNDFQASLVDLDVVPPGESGHTGLRAVGGDGRHHQHQEQQGEQGPEHAHFKEKIYVNKFEKTQFIYDLTSMSIGQSKVEIQGGNEEGS